MRAPSDDELTLLRSQSLLAGLSQVELLQLLGQMEEVRYRIGDVIISEGEMLDDIFFLLEGEVMIEKWDDDRKGRHAIGQLGPGEAFGEMSFLDGSPRSSTVVARGDVKALVLRTAFTDLGAYRTRIVRNIAVGSIDRLRRTSEEYVASLRAELEQAELANRFGRFFIAILAVMAVNSGMTSFIEASGIDIKQTWFAWGALLLLVLPILVFIGWFKYPIATFGLTRRNLWPSMRLGLLSSVGLVIAFVAFREVTGHRGPLFDTSNPRVFGPLLLLYAPHSLVQEFASRGVVQTALQTFLRDERGHLAIAVTSMLFAILHIHHGLVSVLVTLLASVGFGYVYRPHRNLAGVSIVHFVGGTIAESAGWV